MFLLETSADDRECTSQNKFNIVGWNERESLYLFHPLHPWCHYYIIYYKLWWNKKYFFTYLARWSGVSGTWCYYMLLLQYWILICFVIDWGQGKIIFSRCQPLHVYYYTVGLFIYHHTQTKIFDWWNMFTLKYMYGIMLLLSVHSLIGYLANSISSKI